MRLSLRAAAFLALSLAGITCSESATGPKSSAGLPPARIALVPQFSAQATEAYGVLRAAGTDVAEIHIVLTGPDGSRRDTVVAFPPGQDSRQIDIDVPAGTDGQPYTALIELRSSDHTVLFSGTQVVFARPGNFPRTTPAIILISYTGPGRTIRTVTVSPRDTTVAGTPTIAYSATAVDSAGAPVPNVLVGWTSSDVSVATATSTGNAVASVVALGKRGATTLSARTPLGVTGTSVLTVVPPASRLVVISGGNQTARAGSQLPLPFVVEAQASDNLPVPGTSITFRSVTAGGSVATITPRIADAQGRASMVLTLGTIAGAYQFEAAAAGLTPVTVTQTATAGAASAIAIASGNFQSELTGRALPLPLVVRVTDSFGSPVGGATVIWARASGVGTLSASSTTTASDGTTSVGYTLGSTAGAELITATLQGGPSVQFSATATAAGASAITVVSGGGQVALPNTTLTQPLVVRVADAGGNPLSGQPVAFTSASGATFNPTSIATNASGLASTTVTVGATLGVVTLTASSGTLVTSTTASVTVGQPASISKVAGDLQTSAAGTAVPVAPSVLVKDASGNPVVNVVVSFAVATGGGSVTGNVVATNANGIATLGGWTLGNIAGAQTLTATAGSLVATFSANAVAGPAAALAITTAPSSTAASGAPLAVQPVVQLRDAFGNVVATGGLVVTATITSGAGTLANATATTTANGAATFSGLTITGTPGQVTLGFSTPSVPLTAVSGPITLGAGAPSIVALNAGNNQTATVSTAVPVAPSVIVTDAAGNPVSGVIVTFGVITPGAQISNGSTTGTTLNVTTNALGIAALASWTLGSTVQAYVMNATVTGLTGSPVVFTATAAPGTGSQLAFSVAPPTTTASGVALVPQPAIQLKDAQGNNVATPSIPIFAAITSGNGVINNQTASTNGAGVATFNGMSIVGPIGQVTVTFSSPGFAPVASAPITLTVGPANNIAINAGNNQTANAGAAVAVVPSVIVTDGGGNPVSGIVVTFTAVTAGSQVANSSTSGTSVTVTTNAQGIAALTSWTLGGTPQAYTLTAAAATPNSPVTFNATATAGPASQLTLAVQPPSVATIGVPLSTQPVIQLKDAFGNNAAQAGVVVNALASVGSTLVNALATTNASGVATFSGLGFTGATGNFTLQFSATGFTNLVFGTIAVGAGSPSAMTLSAGNNQTAAVGSPVSVAPAVRVTDASGNPVAGVVVTYAVVTAGATVSNASTTGTSVTVSTGANGIATLNAWTLGNLAGPYTMTASGTGLTGSPVTFTATAVPGSGTTLAFVTAPPFNATSGVALTSQPVIQLKDAQGNNATTSGVVITTTITSGTGTLTSATATTNASGTATFSGLAITGTAGLFRLSFDSPGYTGLVFSPINLSAGSPSTIALNGGNNQTAVVGTAVALAPSALVTDAAGNPVSQVPVTFAVVTTGSTVSASGTTATSVTVATNTSGLAILSAWTLGNVAQPYVMTASATGLSGSPVTFNATAVAGPAAALALTVQPSATASSGVALVQQPTVQLKDAFANSVATGGVTVTATISSGSGSLTNASAVTNGSGAAVFSGLAITGGAGQFVLQFSASGVTPALSNTITVGAGAGAALAFSPAWNPGATPALSPFSPVPTVQVVDASGNAVAASGVAVQVTIASGPQSPTPFLVNATTSTNSLGVASFPGLAVGGAAGTYTLSFNGAGLTPVVSGPVVITAGSGATLAISAGNNQTAPVLTAVPVPPSVLLTDSFGNPVPNQVVTFTVQTPGSQVSNASTTGTSVTVTTNPSGVAALTAWTLGATARVYTIGASFPGAATVNIGATAVPGPAASIALNAGDNQTTPAGTTVPVPPSVVVRDAQGNGVGGVSVQFTIVTAGATVSNGSTTTNTVSVVTNPQSGIAQLNAWTLGGTAQTYTMQATLGSVTGSPVTFTATATAGPAAIINFNAGNNQTATVSTAVATPPSVIITDNLANPVSGTVVTFTVLTAGAQISNASTTGTTVTVTSGANGVAALNSWTLGPLAQQYQMSASVTGLVNTPRVFSATAVAGPASVILVQAGNNQTAPVSTSVPTPPAVLITDAQSNPVAGTVVTFTVVTAGAQVQNASTTSSTSLTVTSNAQGIAALTNFFLGAVAQQYTLTASATGLTGSPVTFIETAVAGPANGLSYTTTPSATAQSGAPLATQPVIQLRDARGNAVSQSGLTVTATITSGSGTLTNATAVTNASGTATFSGLAINGVAGPFTLAFNAPQLIGLTANVTLSAGSPSQIAITTQPPATAVDGAAFTTDPVVQVRDNGGNNLSVAGIVIDASIVSGSGTLANAQATTSASGSATFIGMAITGTVGTFTIKFSSASPSISSVPSSPITLTVGPAASVVPLTGTGQTATVSTYVPVAPSVRVTDVGGNPVSGTVVQFFTVPATSQILDASTCCNNLLVTTNASGIASLRAWIMGDSVRTDTLSATVGRLVPARILASAVANSGNTLTITQAPSTTTTSGQVLSPAPTVTARGLQGAPVPGVQVTAFIVLSGGSTMTATLSGTTTATTNASGVATFSNLVITGTTGSVQLRFTIPGYSQPSATISIP